MAVAKNAGDSGAAYAATSFGAAATTLSHTGYTIGAGSDRVLLATLHFNNAGSTDISGLSVTWNSVAMTRIGTGLRNGGRIEFWYLLAPATGNQTATANWTTGSDAVLGLISFTGAGTPIDATTASGSGTNVDITVTSDADGASVAGASTTTNLVSPPATELYTDNTTWVASGVSYTIGGTSNNYVWANAGSWAAMGVHIPVASAAAVVVPDWNHVGLERPFNMSSLRR